MIDIDFMANDVQDGANKKGYCDMSSNSKKYLALEDVADMLGVNYQLIYRLVRSGELPAIKLGRIYRVTEEDLQDYLESKKTSSKGGVCSACGEGSKSSSALKNKCEVCGEPICYDCWSRRNVRRCKEHAEQE